MGFISKAGSCVVDHASKALGFVGGLRNAAITSKAKVLGFVGGSRNAAILLVVLILLCEAVKRRRAYLNKKAAA